MTPDATSSAAWFLVGPRSLEVRRRDLGSLRPGWARVRFLYCGLCGTDVSQFDHPDDYPVSIGHEFLGKVEAVGEGVTAVAVGDVVTSDLNYRCGSCDQCREGRSHLCAVGQVGMFTNRGFADLGDLEATYLVRVAAEARHLALSEPLSCVLHAKRWADPRPGQRILVIGAGSLGLCMAFALTKLEVAIDFDITDRIAERLSSLAAAAAPHARAISRPDGEYDVVFDLSGTESGLREACARVRPGGRLCCMSHLPGDAPGAFLVRSLTARDVTFTVSFLNGERETLETAARLLEQRWDAAWDALLEVVPLEALPGAFEERRSSPWCKTVIKVAAEAP